MTAEFKNPRVFLRKLSKSDAPDLYRLCRDEEVLKGTGIPHKPYTHENAAGFIRQTHRDHRRKTAVHRGIADGGTGRVIGTISIARIDRTHRSAEIGYWLGRPYWGKGLMFEALQQCLVLAFKELRLSRVYGLVFPGNVRSQRLLERANFTLEGRLRRSKKIRNRWTDELVYGILRSEFRSGRR